MCLMQINVRFRFRMWKGWSRVCKYGHALICSVSFSLIELCVLSYRLKHSGMCVGTWSARPSSCSDNDSFPTCEDRPARLAKVDEISSDLLANTDKMHSIWTEFARLTVTWSDSLCSAASLAKYLLWSLTLLKSQSALAAVIIVLKSTHDPLHWSAVNPVPWNSVWSPTLLINQPWVCR